MAEIGFPVIGDFTYSNGKNPFGVKGQMLHSSRVAFIHPRTEKKMELEAPLPKYFEKIIEELECKKTI